MNGRGGVVMRSKVKWLANSFSQFVVKFAWRIYVVLFVAGWLTHHFDGENAVLARASGCLVGAALASTFGKVHQVAVNHLAGDTRHQDLTKETNKLTSFATFSLYFFSLPAGADQPLGVWYRKLIELILPLIYLAQFIFYPEAGRGRAPRVWRAYVPVWFVLVAVIVFWRPWLQSLGWSSTILAVSTVVQLSLIVHGMAAQVVHNVSLLRHDDDERRLLFMRQMPRVGPNVVVNAVECGYLLLCLWYGHGKSFDTGLILLPSALCLEFNLVNLMQIGHAVGVGQYVHIQLWGRSYPVAPMPARTARAV